MPSNKLACPHCGHDGTVETSKPPLQSYGFNYLADGVVCREVRGFDEGGRLRLSGDFKCEGSQGANARIECRSCWQTFAAPDGLPWAVTADQPTQPAYPPADPAEQTKAATETIAHNLVLILSSGMQQLERSSAAEIARLEASNASIAHVAEELPGLRAEVAALRGDAVAALQQLQTSVAAAETALRAQEDNQPKLWEGLNVLRSLQDDHLRKLEEQAASAATQRDSFREQLEALQNELRAQKEAAAQASVLCAQQQAEQQALRQRMDAQAEVIRALHAVAQEQMSRREELRAAVQRLDEIAGIVDPVKPLPKEL